MIYQECQTPSTDPGGIEGFAVRPTLNFHSNLPLTCCITPTRNSLTLDKEFNLSGFFYKIGAVLTSSSYYGD